jgi:hypothetical protein
VDRKSGRFWWFKAFGIFLLCLIGWFGIVVWTGSALGVNLTFAEDLRSHLLANYGIDVSGQNMKYLSLTILGEVFTDEGLTGESLKVVDALLEDPVPTATPNGGGEQGLPTLTLEPSSTPDLTSTAEVEATKTAELTPSATATFTLTATSTFTQTPTSTPTATITPTRTPKPTYTPTPTEKTIQDVIPLVICVNTMGNDEFEAIFGYNNPSSTTQYIPIGDWNRFYPEPKNRDQPTEFLPGKHNSYPGDTFRVMYYGSQLTWHLTGNSATASMDSPDCGGILEPTATPTYETPDDTSPPFVGTGYLSPEPGALTGCSVQIHVDNLRVEDDPYSSGINWVKLKYVVEGYSSEIYSDPLTMVNGGFTGDGGWEGYFSGSVFVEIDPEWPSPVPDDFYVKVWGKALDNAGNHGIATLGSYTMPSSCGKTPE